MNERTLPNGGGSGGSSEPATPTLSSSGGHFAPTKKWEWTDCGGRPKRHYGGLSAKNLGRNSLCFNLAFRCFCRNSYFRQKGLLSAEIASFGRKFHPICLNSLSKLTIILCRKTLFLQKQPLSAERLSFGSFCISAEMNFFESLSFGFRQKEEISLSVAHCPPPSPGTFLFDPIRLYLFLEKCTRASERNY